MGDTFVEARRRMVDGQLRTMDVTDPHILTAVLDIPRERFVPPAQAALAYADLDIDLDDLTDGPARRYLLEPAPLTRLIQLADIKAADLVLDVGCATGYSTAVIGRLAEGVVGLESDAGLAAFAETALGDLGIDNAAIVTGALEDGYPGQGPYDVIVVSGAVERIPDKLVAQLREGGRLVAAVGAHPLGRAWLYTKVAGELSGAPFFDVTVPELPGFAKEVGFVF